MIVTTVRRLNLGARQLSQSTNVHILVVAVVVVVSILLLY